MIILTMLGFIILLLAVIFVLFVVAQYNTLIHLRMTAQQTLQDIIATVLQKTADTASLTDLLASLHKTNSIDKQVSLLNTFHETVHSETKKNTTNKSLLAVEHTIQPEKRFFNNTARELNDRLATFPGQQIGSLLDVHTLPLLTLDDDARAGVMPEAKYT